MFNDYRGEKRMKNKKLLSALVSLILFIVYVAIIYTNRENQWVMALAALVLLPIIAVVYRDPIFTQG